MPDSQESDRRRLERRWNRRTNADGRQKQNPRRRGSAKDENDDAVDFDFEIEDPDYNAFLRNLKEHGSSYKVLVYGDNGEPEEELVYETDDRLPVKQSSREEGVRRSQRPGLEDVDHEDEEYLGFVSLGSREREIEREDSGDGGGERHYIRPLKLIGGGTSPPRPPETRPLSSGDVVGEDCSEFQDKELADDDHDDDDDACKVYSEFLDMLEKGGLDKFEDDDEVSEADSVVVLMDEGLHFEENSTPFVSARSSQVIDVETYCPGKYSAASNSRFKKELLECLKKPYDLKQHQELKSEFECRKPQIEDRKLRGKTKTYVSKDRLGKSYRDQHSDFAELVDLAGKDDRRSLNLLRGFFYWMKNIAQVGVFKPWHDRSILEMVPEK